MKGRGYLFIIILLLAACSGTNDSFVETAKGNAHKYLSHSLPDFSTYKSISFSGPDSIIHSHLNDEVYIRLEDSVMEIEAIRFRDMGENFALFTQRKEGGYYDSKQTHFKKKQDSIARIYKPRFVGYKLEHKFTAADSAGKTILYKYVFCFDEKGNLTEVIK